MSETHEHLEQAEHASHLNDPFLLRVAMTMALIAAVLAAVSLVGHRKHNEALQNQGDANRMHTEAARYKVDASNTFAFYQAKRARVEQREQAISQTKLFALAPDSKEELKKQVAKWQDYIKKNSNSESDITVDARGFPVKDAKGEEDNSPGALIVRGKKYNELADEKNKEAENKEKEYHHVHHQADGLDLAHLSVELGLVLCTICVLTRKREFWITGIIAALVGIGIAAYALLFVH